MDESAIQTPVQVCAAVIRKGGRILLATRPQGKHLAGCWEFPGGKVKPGETYEQCIQRELLEELGLCVAVADELAEQEFDYPEKKVVLHFMECELNSDDGPVPQEGQCAEWFLPEDAAALDLAPADAAFIRKYKALLVS